MTSISFETLRLSNPQPTSQWVKLEDAERKLNEANKDKLTNTEIAGRAIEVAEQLRAYVIELEKDKARLDWLDITISIAKIQPSFKFFLASILLTTITCLAINEISKLK